MLTLPFFPLLKIFLKHHLWAFPNGSLSLAQLANVNNGNLCFLLFSSSLSNPEAITTPSFPNGQPCSTLFLIIALVFQLFFTFFIFRLLLLELGILP